MKLVTFHSNEKECLINCDNITVVTSGFVLEDFIFTLGTIIYFNNDKHIVVDENYKDVEKKLKEDM